MALPGHSPPPPFVGSNSPPRVMNGHSDSQLPPMYAHSSRPMLPPSPQRYRFPNAPPIPTPSPSIPAINDNRGAPPYKRPGSSMSISSMLGCEPEGPNQDVYNNHNSRAPSRQGSMSAPAVKSLTTMSPPLQATRPGVGEYAYKPRSHSPDKADPFVSGIGSRQRSSSSGTPLQRPTTFNETLGGSSTTTPTTRYLEQLSGQTFDGPSLNNAEHDERVRRTSLSGILQRPNSQPLAAQLGPPHQDLSRQNMLPLSFAERPSPPEPVLVDPFRQNGPSGLYDTKPPGSYHAGRFSAVSQSSPTRSAPQVDSPELHRLNENGAQGRTLASILNAPRSQPLDSPSISAQRMIRQDSLQSQGDRSSLGDRGKYRQYSPFASSFNPQNQPLSGVPSDPQSRKGSDELSQHRAILGLAAENKRGRFSPMPQVMQGAQAQTPVPDAGVKPEHGRVFSGLGGNVQPTPPPVGATLRRDDGRSPLNDDSHMKMSRSSSGFHKRSRKLQDEDTNGDGENINGYKSSSGRATKKGKHQYSYKADLEEMANSGFGRRGTPVGGTNGIRNLSATSGTTSLANAQSNYTSNQPFAEQTIPLKPRVTIRVASVFHSASASKRRHLGNFTYRPSITQSDLRRPNPSKFDVSIIPNLLPCFSAADHVNCTYTVHIPRMWLQETERRLICTEQYLWGSGIYTDDSDPIAAAIHAGFLKASHGDAVDASLLSRVVKEQNPRIEWPKDFTLPGEPLEVQQGKDLNITLVVLPLLERYEGSARFGVKSKTWPAEHEKTQHDGVSFAVLKVEFANIGTQEMRIGRLGSSRRERLRLDLESRQQSLRLQEERIARAKKKQVEQLKKKKKKAAANTVSASRAGPTSVPLSFAGKTGNVLAQQVISAAA